MENEAFAKMADAEHMAAMKAKIEKMFSDCDENGDGLHNCSEYVNFCTALANN